MHDIQALVRQFRHLSIFYEILRLDILMVQSNNRFILATNVFNTQPRSSEVSDIKKFHL